MVADVKNGEHMNLRDSVKSCRTSPAHHDSSKCCGGYDESGRISDSMGRPHKDYYLTPSSPMVLDWQTAFESLRPGQPLG
jgi:hypothetical protein